MVVSLFTMSVGYMLLSLLITFRISRKDTPRAFIAGGLFLTLLGMAVIPVLSGGLEHASINTGTKSIIIDFFLVFSYTLGGRALWEGLLKLGQYYKGLHNTQKNDTLIPIYTQNISSPSDMVFLTNQDQDIQAPQDFDHHEHSLEQDDYLTFDDSRNYETVVLVSSSN